MINLTPLKPFRAWVQSVLPTVYDDSLSYYELLSKVVEYLNQISERQNNLQSNFTELSSGYDEFKQDIQEDLSQYMQSTTQQLNAWKSDFEHENQEWQAARQAEIDDVQNQMNILKRYVSEYFDNLDVQQEIDQKLDEMAASGKLSELITPLVPDAVTKWLEANVTPTGSAVMVDKSLSVEGAAADAKVVGDTNAAFRNTRYDLIDRRTLIPNSFLDANHGTISTWGLPGHCSVSDFIPIRAGKLYKAIGIRSVAFYDGSKNFLTGIDIVSVNQLKLVSTPNPNAVFARVSLYSTVSSYFGEEQFEIPDIDNHKPNYNNSILNTHHILNGFRLDPQNESTLIADDQYQTSYYSKIKSGQTYYQRGCTAIAFYNAGYKQIEFIQSPLSTELIAPDNAYYVVCSSKNISNAYFGTDKKQVMIENEIKYSGTNTDFTIMNNCEDRGYFITLYVGITGNFEEIKIGNPSLTNIITINRTSILYLGVTTEHNLSIEGYIDVLIYVKNNKLTIDITSNGRSYSQVLNSNILTESNQLRFQITSDVYHIQASVGSKFLYSNIAICTNKILALTSNAYNYLSSIDCKASIFAKLYATSTDGIADRLEQQIDIIKAKEVVFLSSMTDNSDTETQPDQTWLTAFNKAWNICSQNGIIFKPVTIPSVPGHDNRQKSNYIRNNFRNYVELERAFNNSSGALYPLLLDNNSLPTDLGARILGNALIQGAGEILD